MILSPSELNQLRPRFSRVLAAQAGTSYLANHSLGRPLDATADSLSDFARTWESHMDESWTDERWVGQTELFRSRVGSLLGLASGDGVIAKSSAGQGLRAVLNSFPPDQVINVVATTAEFDSIDFILKAYSEAGRAQIKWVSPTATEGPVPIFESSAVAEAIGPETDLVIVSAVYFTTGQVMHGLRELADHAHHLGALLMVDSYHALGVFPFSMPETGADFVIGGCYKYLRGGPGTGFLALADHVLADGSRNTLDTGWFAKRNPFGYARPETPERGPSGFAWMESTPPIATAYQANPGVGFTLEVGVDRIRATLLKAQSTLIELLKEQGVPVFEPTSLENFGAFVLVPHASVHDAVTQLKSLNVTVDGRGGFVRFGPDILADKTELSRAADAARQVWRS